jgi:hypothetical protein
MNSVNASTNQILQLTAFILFIPVTLILIRHALKAFKQWWKQ